MKIRFLLLMLCMNVNHSYAQEIKVRNVVELTTDITARSAARLDNNGNECAVVRVNIPTIKTMNFESIVGDATYSAGEYVLYLSGGTQKIPYSVKGYKSGVIDFDKYGIAVKGKTVYRATLYISNGDTNKQVSNCTLKLTTQPESALILIDGIPVGESPLVIDNLRAGDHVISFPNSIRDNIADEDDDDEPYGGYTLSDQTITLKAGETLEKHYVLEKKPILDVSDQIEQEGSTMDGGGVWPVKFRNIGKNGKRGLVDYWNREVIPCEYDYIDRNSRGNIFMVGENDAQGELKVGIYKPGKGLILPCEYGNFLWDDNTPLIRACKNGQWGLADYDGNMVVPCIFENIRDLQCGAYIIAQEEEIAGSHRKRNAYGLLGADGHVIMAPQYDYITNFSEGYAIACDFDKKYFLVDSLGHRITSIPAGYHLEWYEKRFRKCYYTEGLLCLVLGEKFGVLDKFGNELVPFIYKEKIHVGNGWCVLRRYVEEKKENEYMIIDKNGHSYQLSEKEYYGPIGQYIHIKRKGKEGLIDQNGKTILPFDFDYLEQKHEYIVAQKKGEIIIYNLSLQELLRFDSEENLNISTIKDDIILLYDRESGRYGYMNMKGEVLSGCLYENGGLNEVYINLDDTDKLITNRLAMLCVGDRCGLMNKEGRIVVPLIYSAIVPFYDGTVYALKLDGTWEDLDLEELKK